MWHIWIHQRRTTGGKWFEGISSAKGRRIWIFLNGRKLRKNKNVFQERKDTTRENILHLVLVVGNFTTFFNCLNRIKEIAHEYT